MTSLPAPRDPVATAPPRVAAPALAALLVANVALAFGPLLVRQADVGPTAAAFWRMALATPLLFALAPAVGQPLRRPGWRVAAAITLAGLFFAADLAAWHAGILRTRLANATLFGNATSFLFPIWGFVAARRLPGRMQGAALLLAAIGVALLMGRSYELSRAHFAGDLLCLAAALAYTAYLIVIDRARVVVQPLPLLAMASLATLAPLWIAAFAAGEVIVPHRWLPLVLLALGSQLIGQGLITSLLGRLPPLVIGLGLLFQPVVAAAIGWSLYGERLGTADVAGALMIGAALVLVRRGG